MVENGINDVQEKFKTSVLVKESVVCIRLARDEYRLCCSDIDGNLRVRDILAQRIQTFLECRVRAMRVAEGADAGNPAEEACQACCLSRLIPRPYSILIFHVNWPAMLHTVQLIQVLGLSHHKMAFSFLRQSL